MVNNRKTCGQKKREEEACVEKGERAECKKINWITNRQTTPKYRALTEGR